MATALLYESSPPERLNDARNYFHKLMESWNNRLCLKGQANVEHYRSGSMALICECDSSTIQLLIQSHPSRSVHEVRGIFHDHVAFLVLKADTDKPHKLESWNEELVFVRNVQLVYGPEGVIPSLVRFYRIEKKLLNSGSNLLLLQSLSKFVFNVLPRVENWEPCPPGWPPTAFQNGRVVEKIQSTSQIVQGVSNDDRCDVQAESGSVNVKSQVVGAAMPIRFDFDGVKIRRDKFLKQGIDVADVFFGPFNLQT
ncbi:MAG TPA: hypothetical protein VMS96_02360 [Terriglobales bacterium]|nr:hypothetical protein [Terriglobales bacterium]